ncbi:MAG TPA: signal peptidase I, partial [Micromonosporaceae bacterium]|nr:signal peptidase I [Micromonosporaceae bacterium]
MIDEQTGKRRSSFWRELPILLGVAILVAVVVRAFVLQTFYIPSPSMEHTLDINDRVLVNKLVYDFRDPHRGEIVVFRAPEQWRNGPEGEDFI